MTSGVRVSIAACTASRISGCGNRSMTASTSVSTSASAVPIAPFGTTKRTRLRSARPPSRSGTVRRGIDADDLFDTGAGDEIGDRRPALQAEAAENRDLHAGSLRAGASRLSDQQPSGQADPFVAGRHDDEGLAAHDFAGLADAGDQLAGDAVEIGDIAGHGHVDDDVEAPGDHRGRVHERQFGDALRHLPGAAAPLRIDADDRRDQFRALGQVEQPDDLEQVAVEQVAQPCAHRRHRYRHLLGEAVDAELRILRQQLDQPSIGLIEMFPQAIFFPKCKYFGRVFSICAISMFNIFRAQHNLWRRHRSQPPVDERHSSYASFSFPTRL